jgi:predicted lipopolysaccharide heptosyltransferase III
MQNILVIKLRYIGDVLLATPVLRALREQFPTARLTMVVNRGTEDILKRNPDVSEVLGMERGQFGAQIQFVQDLRRRRFDCVIDLTDGDRSAILTVLSGAPIRIGFNDEHRWRGLLYTSVAKARPGVLHRAEHDLEAVRALGIIPKVSQPVLHTALEDEAEATRLLEAIGVEEKSFEALSLKKPSKANKRPLVLLQPGARYWFKAWPVDRFAELADRLAEAFDCQILVGGDQRDCKLAESIRAKARSSPLVLAGRANLLHYAAIIKRCDLFVSNDNGPMHMAAALGTPVVALFGPSNPQEWGPCGEKVQVLYKGLDCRRCFHPTCERGEESCMKQISVEEVFVAAAKFLTGSEARHGG